MKAIVRLLLFFTLLVSSLSAPKFHLIETEDEEGVDEVGSNQEDDGEEGGADKDLENNQEEDRDYSGERVSACTFLSLLGLC